MTIYPICVASAPIICEFANNFCEYVKSILRYAENR